MSNINFSVPILFILFLNTIIELILVSCRILSFHHNKRKWLSCMFSIEKDDDPIVQLVWWNTMPD